MSYQMDFRFVDSNLPVLEMSDLPLPKMVNFATPAIGTSPKSNLIPMPIATPKPGFGPPSRLQIPAQLLPQIAQSAPSPQPMIPLCNSFERDMLVAQASSKVAEHNAPESLLGPAEHLDDVHFNRLCSREKLDDRVISYIVDRFIIIADVVS